MSRFQHHQLSCDMIPIDGITTETLDGSVKNEKPIHCERCRALKDKLNAI